MIHILQVAENKDSLSGMNGALMAEEEMEIHFAKSASRAMAMAGQVGYDLVIADEKIGDMKALTLAENLTRLNPMINCAVVSSLSKEDFHEAGEGLGILLQLPADPGASDAGTLLARLKEVLGMTGGGHRRSKSSHDTREIF